jgi:hypothetical protein
MDIEKTNKLIQEAPTILWYLQKNDSSESFLPIAFGFECGDGWFAILQELFNKLEQYAVQNNLDNFYIMQVKEKFGSLRVYTSYENEEISSLIEQAELKSQETCEICGNKGKPNRNGWISTLCKNCRKKTISVGSNTIPIQPKD